MLDEDLSRIEHTIELYTQHLLRKALSSSITPRALEALKANPTRCHGIVDYKQKWLPMKHHETQSDSFGKRGKSIWGGCFMRWDPTTGDYDVLNVRIACDDSKQNWYHSLACLRTNLEIVKSHSADLTETSLQSDGAGNYSCTAFMTSLPRVGEVSGLRIVGHAITEVGDGKNLVDTDFQQVTMSLNQRLDGGADVETAQQILDNLDANRTVGTTNAAIDFAERAEGKAPKPYAGIDGIYHRVFVYDEGSGRCTGVRLHQFYNLGQGRVVGIGALRELWKEGGQLDAGSIPTTRLHPSAGEKSATSKKKLSSEHAVTAKALKKVRRDERAAKKVVALLDELASERRREQERTTFPCAHGGAGCRHRFLCLAVGGVRARTATAARLARGLSSCGPSHKPIRACGYNRFGRQRSSRRLAMPTAFPQPSDASGLASQPGSRCLGLWPGASMGWPSTGSSHRAQESRRRQRFGRQATRPCQPWS